MELPLVSTKESKEDVLAARRKNARPPAVGGAFRKLQQELLVLEIPKEGQSRYVHLRRGELLEKARSSMLIPKKEEPVSVDQTPSKTPRSPRWRKKGLFGRYAPGTLQSRDLRRLDTNFASSSDPEIVVRRGSFIANLGDIKTLTLFDRCFVVVPPGADSILSILLKTFNTPDVDDSDNETDGLNLVPKISAEVPFEFHILEAILRTVCSRVVEDVSQVQPAVKKLMVNESISATTFQDIRKETLRVSKLTQRIKGLQHAISELLASDRDMALLSLTRVREHPEWYLEENAKEWAQDHENAELLLEHYVSLNYEFFT